MTACCKIFFLALGLARSLANSTWLADGFVCSREPDLVRPSPLHRVLLQMYRKLDAEDVPLAASSRTSASNEPVRNLGSNELCGYQGRQAGSQSGDLSSGPTSDVDGLGSRKRSGRSKRALGTCAACNTNWCIRLRSRCGQRTQFPYDCELTNCDASPHETPS